MVENKDDTILVDRISFLECENAELKAKVKQRRAIFDDISGDAQTAMYVIATIAIICMLGAFTAVGVANFWPEDTHTVVCDEDRVERAYEECLEQDQRNSPDTCRIQAKRLFCREVKASDTPKG